MQRNANATPTYTDEEREQMRLARNRYQREWRRANVEKVRAQKDRYWARKAQQLQGDTTKE